MRTLVLESLSSLKLASLVSQLWFSSVDKNHIALINKVDAYLRQNYTWTEDQIDGVPMEAIQTPEYMIQGKEMRGYYNGDCDDISTLEAAILTGMGIQCRFVVIRSKADAMVYDHVYIEAFANGEWIVSDITVPKEVVHKYYQRLEINI